MNNRNLVIFDFCDTLFRGQSISYYINFLISKESFFKRWYLKFRRKLIPPTGSRKHKEFILKPFSGYSLTYFEEISYQFYQQVVKERFHSEIINKLIEHKKRGDFVIVISGGFDIYLKHLIKDYDLDGVISTGLKFTEDSFSGEILGEECLGEQKVLMCNRMLSQVDEKFEKTVCYTDHHSDVHLLDFSDEGYVVDFGQDLSWVKDKWQIIKI